MMDSKTDGQQKILSLEHLRIILDLVIIPNASRHMGAQLRHVKAVWKDIAAIGLTPVHLTH